MLVSMTGYGRAESKRDKETLLVEISSQNRKFFEVVLLNLPDSFFGLEIEIKKELKKNLHRGHVIVKFFSSKDKDLQSLERLSISKMRWEKLACSLGYKKESIDLPFLLEVDKKASAEEEVFYDKDLFLKTLKEATASLLNMREEEGRMIAKDFLNRIEDITTWIKEIKEQAQQQPSAYKEKLEKRLEEYGKLGDEDRERISKEIVLFSDKVDITEELVRIESHLSQFMDLIHAKETILGKKLDFICQELFRETNTIASKSCFTDIIQNSIKIKSELEKIREQVQNIV